MKWWFVLDSTFQKCNKILRLHKSIEFNVEEYCMWLSTGAKYLEKFTIWNILKCYTVVDTAENNKISGLQGIQKRNNFMNIQGHIGIVRFYFIIQLTPFSKHPPSISHTNNLLHLYPILISQTAEQEMDCELQKLYQCWFKLKGPKSPLGIPRPPNTSCCF